MKNVHQGKKGNYGKAKGPKQAGGFKGSKSTKQTGSMRPGAKSKGGMSGKY